MQLKPFIVLSISIIILVACKQDNVRISTNYYDLPEEHEAQLQELLKTNDLDTLGVQSMDVMQKTLSYFLMEAGNPHNRFMSSNYFWNIYNALPHFVSADERHSGYQANEGDYDLNDRLLAYSIYRIDRSPENLTRIFNYFEPLLPKILSPAKYEHYFADHVLALLNTYNAIAYDPDFRQKLEESYQIVDTTTGYWYNSPEGEATRFRLYANSAYGFTAGDVSEIISRQLNMDRYHHHYADYNLSFWMRRQHEGNLDVVYEILNKVSQMYRPKNVMERQNIKDGKLIEEN